LGWREGILILVVLAVLYVIVTVLKLTRIGHRRPARQGVGQVVPQAYVIPPAEPELAVPVEMFAAPPAQSFDWDDVDELFGDAGEGAVPANAPSALVVPAAPSLPLAPRTAGFGEHLAEHLARSEMEMEVQRMRAEMERMRSEVEELRAARHVSPQYAEAMELAQRGLTAQDVADQLGISLAEAELVQALSRSDGNFDEGEQYGEDATANHDGFNAFDRTARHSGSGR